MKSGIYKLIFTSGKCYIGKSADIDARWRQHTDRFNKGDTAGKLQQEYNRCGMPQLEVIFECHVDHVDIMETYCVHAHDRGLLLNTSIPEALEQEDYNKLLMEPELLKYSTADHVALIASLNKEAHEYRADINKMKTTANPLESEIERLKDEVNYYKAQPWYSKIFS